MKKEDWFLEYVELNEVEKAKAMIEKDEVNINAVNDYKENALLLALGNGQEEFADYLIDKGIKLNQKNEGKDTAVIIACREGYTELAKKMIKKGADVNIDNDFGETAVAIAASSSQNDVLKTMIAGGAKLNSIERMNGHTPLISTVYNRNLEGCRLLLEAGAKASIRSADGRSVLDYFEKAVQQDELKQSFLEVFFIHRKSFDDKDRDTIKTLRYESLK